MTNPKPRQCRCDRRVSPCVAPCGEIQPNGGNTSSAEAKRRLGRFSHPFAETDRRYENKQEKARGCLAFPSQDTADGNADRIRLCGAFEDYNKNCDLGVARIKTSQV